MCYSYLLFEDSHHHGCDCHGFLHARKISRERRTIVGFVGRRFFLAMTPLDRSRARCYVTLAPRPNFRDRDPEQTSTIFVPFTRGKIRNDARVCFVLNILIYLLSQKCLKVAFRGCSIWIVLLLCESSFIVLEKMNL